MTEYLAPGVFVEEMERGPRPIQGVPTHVTAMIGMTGRGTTDPTRVASALEFAQEFGGESDTGGFLPTAARGFFENGGRQLVVCRVVAAVDGSAVGADDFARAIARLDDDRFGDVALVYAPHAGVHAAAVHRMLIEHCERQRFRFAVLDCDPGIADPRGVDPAAAGLDTQYAALYLPWVCVADPAGGARRCVPPGGHVLGVYARTDLERGVFKAPANQVLRGVATLEYEVDRATQEVLNPRGVDVIRDFPGRGIRVWGARTLSSNPQWKYVNVRRLFIFLERSIYEGTKWVVFEPNDEKLWARVRDTIRLFLRAQWRSGALLGAKEEEAFFITCDPSTMTQDDIVNGRLICEIGVAPVRPAEFVIFRIFLGAARP